jgi:hypothetical protein
MAHSAVLRHIRALDPERDHQRIAYLMTCYEFPFDITRALEFALFRTYAVPSISRLLDHTGEFALRTQKRYDDTDLLLSEILEHGYDSERGRAALRRMNRLHGRFTIANDDFLYVLSTFIFEPLRWLDRFGWRPVLEGERQALFYFWSAVGQRMNIKGIPVDMAAFERFNRDYEARQFRYAQSNRRVGDSTRDLFLGWFLPALLRPLGAPSIYALMDEPLLDAFGYPHPPSWLRGAVKAAVRVRGRVAHRLLRRRRPRLRTHLRTRTYPEGYRIEALGPPPADTPSPKPQ